MEIFFLKGHSREDCITELDKKLFHQHALLFSTVHILAWKNYIYQAALKLFIPFLFH